MAFALLLVAASVSVEAKPLLPKTQKVARGMLHASLSEADATGAAALARAQGALDLARSVVSSLPPVSHPLDVRLVFVQAGIRGEDGLLSAAWVGTGGDWEGVWWVESETASSYPRFLAFGPDGTIVQAFGGASARASTTSLTFHFLGSDGEHVALPVGEIPLLRATPTLGAVDAGGAKVSARGADPEALFLTPWNLVGESVSMGFSILAGDATLRDVEGRSCADPLSTSVENGCRALYVVPFPPEATSVALWRVDAQGERVVDRVLQRAQLEAGYAFRA